MCARGSCESFLDLTFFFRILNSKKFGGTMDFLFWMALFSVRLDEKCFLWFNEVLEEVCGKYDGDFLYEMVVWMII
jgi:hypothetical protein